MCAVIISRPLGPEWRMVDKATPESSSTDGSSDGKSS